MLCQQVLRMCRGEGSEQQNVNNEWVSVEWDRIDINKRFRAKPKKELVVPWEWLPDDVTELTITVNKVIYNNRGYTVALKLALTDIELPVTVHRPQR